MSPRDVGFKLNDILLSTLARSKSDFYWKPREAFKALIDRCGSIKNGDDLGIRSCSMSIAIRPETAEDRQSIWNVNKAAFDSYAEANLVDELRDDSFVEVSLIAEADTEIVGHILFSCISIITKVGTVEAVCLAPMAVLPEYQRQGIGSKLVEAGLEACREQGHKIVVVLGHPEFYPRFGFSAELAKPLENPFGSGDAWMALELVPGALADVAGRVEYPPPFGDFE